MIPHAYIVVGLAFGDEGKGTMVDYLARLYGANLVVRFSGGPQCGHNVVSPDGLHHKFSQLGSASFVSGVKTHLSREMMIEPFALTNEIVAFVNTTGDRSVIDRLTIDPLCLVITPFHWFLNRQREESRLANRHGSCGMGVGEVRLMNTVRHLSMWDLADPGKTIKILMRIKDYAIAESLRMEDRSGYRRKIETEDVADLARGYKNFSNLIKCLHADELFSLLWESVTIFEGSQGVLLDEDYGFAPYNTWTKTTTELALRMLDINLPRTKIGVVRTYFTRHGPGPFPSEDDVSLEEVHNPVDEWQGGFRTGAFDLVALRYALNCCPVDCLALTHCDRSFKEWPCVVGYCFPDGRFVAYKDVKKTDFVIDTVPEFHRYSPEIENVVGHISDYVQIPIRFTSYGPTAKEKYVKEV